LAVLALLVSIAAIVIALMAYERTGADLKLRQQVESLQQALDGARQETANALDRLEKRLRGTQERQR
jgi:predicted nucleic acid-binding protein